MKEELRPNPFRHMGQWYWRDGDELTHGPYKTQRQALFGLLKHVYPDETRAPSSSWGAVEILALIILVSAVVCWALGL